MSDGEEKPDHFTRFGLPQVFAVDEAQLMKCYYDLQRSHHPDRFINALDEQQQWAVQQAAAINQAFHTLKDPLRRAEYLLTLHGLGHQEEQAQDAAFLLEQLELREALTTLTDQAAIAPFAARVDALQDSHYQQLIHALEISAWAQASQCLSKLKFLTKLQQQVRQLELEVAPCIP